MLSLPVNHTRNREMDGGEMCISGVSYYYDAALGPRAGSPVTCTSHGPPLYQWSSDQVLAPVPASVDKEASDCC